MAAAVLPLENPRHREIKETFGQDVVIGNAREIAGKKFIEIGERILKGELDGGRCEWRSNAWLEDEQGKPTKMVFVELDRTKGEVQLQLFTIVEG